MKGTHTHRHTHTHTHRHTHHTQYITKGTHTGEEMTWKRSELIVNNESPDTNDANEGALES